VALSPFQRDICRLLAAGWRASGESYVAGGAALGVALATARISRDLDIFHDSTEAVARSWDRDRAALAQAGFAIELVRERPGFVEALVRRADDVVVMEWARDSAFRFFPLVEHPELGLSLHPVDLATNKVLAMISRAEVRDWLDVIDAELRLQPFGFLAWAAAGKDPGFSPAGIVGHARRTSRYTARLLRAARLRRARAAGRGSGRHVARRAATRRRHHRGPSGVTRGRAGADRRRGVVHRHGRRALSCTA
jgi:hypothetical protein